MLYAALFTLHFSLFASHAKAQGLPLVRNFTAGEYGGHNRCYDIVTGDDGTVYVANFEGLLYYDRAQWRMLYTPDISRVTSVYRDSSGTIWAGGYRFCARIQKHDNGELFLQQVDAEEAPAEIQGIDADAVVLDEIIQTETIDGGLQVRVKKNSGLIIADDRGGELYTITEGDGLCSNQVAGVAYDGHGLLWGATAHGIFAIEIPSVYSYLLAKDGLSGDVHAIIAFDAKIYVGGTGGLYSVSERKIHHIPDISNICWELCQWGDYLLAATSSGIYRISQGGSVAR